MTSIKPDQDTSSFPESTNEQKRRLGWPAVSVEVQVQELVLVRQSSLSPLVLAVQDVCVVGQAFVMSNVLAQGFPILTYGIKEGRERKTDETQGQVVIWLAIIEHKTWCRRLTGKLWWQSRHKPLWLLELHFELQHDDSLSVNYKA